MSQPGPDELLKGTFLEGRKHQAFPILSAEELDRLRRFGEVHRYESGEKLFEVGAVAHGLFVLLQGRVQIGRRGYLGERIPIDQAHPGMFLGELAQLSGRPAMFDGHAIDPVEALRIPPEGIRSVLVAEAEVGERIMRALILRRAGLVQLGYGGPLLVGPSGSPDLVRLLGFLTRNGHPHVAVDPLHDEVGRKLLAEHAPGPGELPLVLCPDGRVLRNPSDEALARALGLLDELSRTEPYDVAVVGAGPAGLATAVYAASEGLAVLVIDAHAFGGQAGASARIENYLGFPTGVSGQTLAGRAFTQALKFGAEFAIPAEVKRLDTSRVADRVLGLELASGRKVRARSVVVASGARYRRPSIPGLGEFEGRGVSYWASPVEARLCTGQEVVLVGGGNSAGQAAVYLAGHASRVRVLVRGPGLAATMSSYLVDRIAAAPNIELLAETEVVSLDGTSSDGLQRIRWRNRRTGRVDEHAICHLFLFVGADPAIEWAGGALALDAKGFVQTGAEVPGHRMPLPFEGSVPGVFAVGDVRSGSVKRVGGAIGEGAAVVAQIHAYLARPGDRVDRRPSPVGHLLDLKIPPPAIAAVLAGLMWVCARAFPAASFVLPGTRFIAPALALAGLAISGWGAATLRRAGTTLNPFFPRSASTLVVTGIYRVTRHPMYLGLLLVLTGWGLHLSSSLAVALLSVYGFYLNRFQIEVEERALTALFGQAQLSYQARVGRWI